VEGVWGEGIRDALFGLGGLLGSGEKEEIPGVAIFIQGNMGGEGDETQGR
jgi:hypothetical protein